MFSYFTEGRRPQPAAGFPMSVDDGWEDLFDPVA